MENPSQDWIVYVIIGLFVGFVLYLKFQGDAQERKDKGRPDDVRKKNKD